MKIYKQVSDHKDEQYYIVKTGEGEYIEYRLWHHRDVDYGGFDSRGVTSGKKWLAHLNYNQGKNQFCAELDKPDYSYELRAEDFFAIAMMMNELNEEMKQ